MSRRNNSKQNELKTNIQQPCNSWIMLLKADVIEGSDCKTDIELLRHPVTGEAAHFLFSESNNSVHEILTYAEDTRSWFIDESVKNDGRLRLSAPIDPIFLVLPYLRKCSNDGAVPLDQILHDGKYPAVERLMKCDGLKYLTSVADKKGCQDIIAYKYNAEKTLVWLEKKTTALAQVLRRKNIHISSDATSSTFKKVENNESIDDNVFLRYAAGIVSDYLAEDLNEKFLKYLNLPEEEVRSIKRKSDATDMLESKKLKFEKNLSPKKNGNLSKKAAKSVASNSKSKSKAAAKCKSITSFFKTK